MTEILLIAGTDSRDEELVAAAAAHHPDYVTVLLQSADADVLDWAFSDTPEAVQRRDRLATLLTATERATGGATVVGLVGDPMRLQLAAYDFVVGGRKILTTA
jgi:hypothetical protein